MSLFQTHSMNGVQFTFDNGYTVSIQWGYGNYCDNYNNKNANKFAKDQKDYPSKTAEIAAWDKNGVWYTFEDTGDTVKGYQTANDVAQFIAMIAAK